MRLIPFDHADEIALRLSDRREALAKASEAHLPPDERRQCFVPGSDPVELTPVVRSEPAPPLIDVGQGRVIEDMERDAVTMACAVAICAAVPIGIGIAQLLVMAADAAGKAWFS